MSIFRVTEPLPSPTDPAALFGRFRGRHRPAFLDGSVAYRDEPAWSVLAFDPCLFLRAKGRDIEIERRLSGRVERLQSDPFTVLDGLLARIAAPREAAASGAPFQGGALGYFGYDLVRHLERIPDAHADANDPDDLQLGIYNKVIVYEPATGACFMHGFGVEGDEDFETPDQLRAWMRSVAAEAATDVASGFTASAAPTLLEPSDLHPKREHYMKAVAAAREHIAAGDIFQANISACFEQAAPACGWETWLALRAVNPAPFAAYLHFHDMTVLSASPERFLRRQGARLQTRPIKGTRKRTDGGDDAAVKHELLHADKDRAELAMIVDVERNDLGRLCRPGSVRVTEPCVVETLPTLFHLVATVEGELEAGLSAVDVLRATFPSGSITGAPKIRAMEIIDALEDHRRGPYTGAIGWIGVDGDMDLSIAIRVLTLRGGRARYCVGAGIVADSDPAREYEEILAKGRALHSVLPARAGRS